LGFNRGMSNDWKAGEPDEATLNWGVAEGDTSTKVRVRKGQPEIKHLPFYKFPYYPDVLDLRKCGYEIENFAVIFDQLDEAHYRHAMVAHILLHLPTDEFGRMGDGSGGNPTLESTKSTRAGV
jgi:hypothetical protein